MTHYSNFAGNRYIANWRSDGDAFINEYFVRLTPDRQSKSGYLWSSETFGDGEFVTTIKFRISGQVRIIAFVDRREQICLEMVFLCFSCSPLSTRTCACLDPLKSRERCSERMTCSMVLPLPFPPLRTLKFPSMICFIASSLVITATFLSTLAMARTAPMYRTRTTRDAFLATVSTRSVKTFRFPLISSITTR